MVSIPRWIDRVVERVSKQAADRGRQRDRRDLWVLGNSPQLGRRRTGDLLRHERRSEQAGVPCQPLLDVPVVDRPDDHLGEERVWVRGSERGTVEHQQRPLHAVGHQHLLLKHLKR